ncbi:unnamed protein product [Arabidopsis halleri]
MIFQSTLVDHNQPSLIKKGMILNQVTNPLIKRSNFRFRGGMTDGTGLVNNKLSWSGSFSLRTVCLVSYASCIPQRG